MIAARFRAWKQIRNLNLWQEIFSLEKKIAHDSINGGKRLFLNCYIITSVAATPRMTSGVFLS